MHRLWSRDRNRKVIKGVRCPAAEMKSEALAKESEKGTDVSISDSARKLFSIKKNHV